MPALVTKATKTKQQPALRVPQARVLKALMPKDSSAHFTEWPTYNRVTLASRAGFNPTTGTINRVLNGIPEGSSSGDPHLGLIARGLMTARTLELDGGVRETVYRITAAGVKELERYLAQHKIPAKRDEESCTNTRYLEDDE